MPDVAELEQLCILLERVQDTALQRRATRLYRALVEDLPNTASIALMRSRQSGKPVFRISGASMFRRIPGAPEARFLAIDIPLSRDRTSLQALERPEGMTRYVLTWSPSVVRLPRGATNLGHVDLTELKRILTDAVKRDRKKLLHELTHFVDVARLGREAWTAASRGYRSDTEDPAAYANHPLELNAYFQQLASAEREDFDAAMNGNDPAWDLWRWLDMDVKQTVREFTSKIERSVWSHLSERNKRRLRSRAALLFAEMQQQARSKLTDLAAEGDEDAQYVVQDADW